jgi:hypothetical protein
VAALDWKDAAFLALLLASALLAAIGGWLTA